MKICVISNLKKSGYGESTRPYYLSKELKKHGHDILHICQRESGMEDGIQYLKHHAFGEGNGLFSRTMNFFYLSLYLKRFKPDLIYVHQFNNVRWAIASKTLPPVPIVFDAHTSVYFEDKAFGADKEKLDDVFRIEKEVCEKSDYIIAASQSTRELLIGQFDVPKEKIFVVENATPIQPVDHPQTNSNSQFICAATIPIDGFKSNEMALEFLFEVGKLMNGKDKQVQFRVIGGGKKPVPPTSNITYTGYVPDLAKSLLEADVCLSPYPDNAVCGGIRNKVCDYLALAKATVSTKEGMRGFMDLQNGTHYLEGNTPEEFANAILRLKSDKALREKLEINALAASHNYQWDKKGEQLNAIFALIKGK